MLMNSIILLKHDNVYAATNSSFSYKVCHIAKSSSDKSKIVFN